MNEQLIEIHTLALILVMDTVRMDIVSQNRKIIDIVTLLLIPQTQPLDKTYLNQVIMHFIRIALGIEG